MLDMKLILFVTAFIAIAVKITEAGNACCSYPCLNGGICMTTGHDKYMCDCTDLNYYGSQCQTPYLWTRIKSWFALSADTKHFVLTHFSWMWWIINNVSFLREGAMKRVVMSRTSSIDSPPTYSSEHEYITSEAYFNLTFYTRTLPPVPKECPKPMGIAGPKQLPDIDMLVEKFFKRRKFIPEPTGTSALFSFFAQHFTHQFFKTDLKKGPQFQWGQHGVDCSNIYGRDLADTLKLRTMTDGKMKTQIINGEVWPPNVKDANVQMQYKDDTPPESRFALGHDFFGILPGLIMWSTIFIREHNNICDQLIKEHPDWSDEQLFQTARLAIIAETIKIVIEDYVQHLSGYNYKLVYNPEILFGEAFQYQNRISVEFNHLYHWHPLMPSTIEIGDTNYTMRDIVYDPSLVLRHGFKELVDSISRQPAGRFGPRNHDETTHEVVKYVIKHGRDLRLQSFNQYRKKFNAKPYTSFEDWTGDTELAKELSEAYEGDIDAVEYFVGLCLEKHRPGAFFGESVTEIGAPYSIFGLFANPISTPRYWKPSTFGGKTIFNRVKTMNIQRLFCENIEGECPYVSFKVPEARTPKKNFKKEL